MKIIALKQNNQMFDKLAELLVFKIQVHDVKILQLTDGRFLTKASSKSLYSSM